MAEGTAIAISPTPAHTAISPRETFAFFMIPLPTPDVVDRLIGLLRNLESKYRLGNRWGEDPQFGTSSFCWNRGPLSERPVMGRP
jgi:hypothetical protein